VDELCKWCLKHGAGGKWYLNAKNYLRETAESVDAFNYLEALWGNFEKIYIRKVLGISSKGIDYKLKLPIIGRVARWYIQRGIEKERNQNPLTNEGHFGQVIPLEEAKRIVTEMADTVVRAICPCRWMHRGMREESCLAFTALAEVLPRLPRYIPETGLKQLDGDEAASFLEEMDRRGRVHTIWTGPVPYIAALCSCDYPQCAAIRVRVDFGIKAVYKGEYVATLDPDKCVGCRKCAGRCPFGALVYADSLGRPVINVEKCWGCGLCASACEEGAIRLVPRDELPMVRGVY